MRISRTELRNIIKQEIENDPEIQKLLGVRRGSEGHQEEIDEKKKKGKKFCVKGAPFHNQDGEFTDPEEDSGSVSMPKTGGDCKGGKAARKQANRRETFTKLPCGRGAKYRCKDGTAKWGKGAVRKEGNYEIKTRAQDKRDKERESLSKERKRKWLDSAGRQLGLGITEGDIDEAVRSETLNFLQQMKEDRIQDPKRFRARCKALGLQSYEEFLNAINKLAAAEKGDLHKPITKEKQNILDYRKL